MEFDAILFDLDDTILDRDKTLHRFADRFLQKYCDDMDYHSKLIFENYFRKIDERGNKPRKEVFAELGQALSWKHRPDLEEQLAFWNTEFPKCTEPMDGLHDVLEFFQNRRIKMGIVTNGFTVFQNTKIDRLGIRQYIKTILISEEVGFRKPDPEIFRLALAGIDSDPGRTLFVGDDPTVDIKGANDSGLISVWLSGHKKWIIEQYRPQVIINRISDLKQL